MPHFTPPAVPEFLADLPNWLVWRMVPVEGGGKPRKIPYYASGPARPNQQGTPEDRALLVTFAEACAAVMRSQEWDRPYTGLGFAPLEGSGVVALDFDDCVADGVLPPHVEDICAGTYTEISPSGRGVRAFFRGTLVSHKDVGPNMKGPWPIEVFGHNGYVTVTGNITPTCEMFGWAADIAPLTPAVMQMYTSRGWDPLARADLPWESGDAGDLMSIAPTLGLSHEKIAEYLADLPEDLDYDSWLGVGQSVHQETNGSEEGFRLWDNWSRLSPKYTTEEYGRARWKSFGRFHGAQRTMKSVIKQAEEARARKKYAAVDDWKRQVKACTDEFELREKLCAQIRRDDTLDEVARESLAQVLQKQLKDLGTKLPIEDCRDMVFVTGAGRTPTVLTPRPLTEFGLVDRMLDRYAHELMYVPELDSWYCWTGIYWRKATSVEIEFRAKETIKHLAEEVDSHQGDDARKHLFEFCAYAQSARMVKNMVTIATSDVRVMVPARELDKFSHLLGVENGVVDLRTGTLLPPNPEFRVTKVCGCSFDANAQAPLWLQTIGEVFSGDAELVDYFHRALGYSALGRPSEDLLFIPFGNGANGKSTVLGTIRRAFGGYAKAADASSFVSDGKGSASAGGAREDLLRLKGARFVYVNEPDENGELREGAVKSMAGGDAITARGLYTKDSVEIVPSWVVWMPTNHKPIVKGSDNGIWRRLVLLPFTRNFESDPAVKKDGDREEKLVAELPGVLAWVVRGVSQYRLRGLTPPKSVAAARDSYRAQMDLLAEWLEDCCEIGPEFAEESNRLWMSWEAFAKNRGIIQYVKSSVALGRRLDARFPSAKGSRGVRMRMGLRIRNDFSGFDVTKEAEGVAGVAGEDLFS